MQDNPYLIGIVEKSDTMPRGCGGLITKLLIAPESKLEAYLTSPDEKLEMNVPGRHSVRVSDRLRIKYKIYSGVYLGISYDILDDNGNVLHSDVSDDISFKFCLNTQPSISDNL